MHRPTSDKTPKIKVIKEQFKIKLKKGTFGIAGNNNFAAILINDNLSAPTVVT